MSVNKDYDRSRLPQPQPLKHKDANNVMREVRIIPFSGEFNNSLWFLFELCLLPLVRCIATLGMTWPAIFTELLNVLGKHPLQIMTSLITQKYSTPNLQTQTNFIHLIRDFVSKLTQNPNPRDSLYHYLENKCRFNPASTPVAHWSDVCFLRKCGIYMHGLKQIPSLSNTALWLFNHYPPGWQCSYVMHNPTETGLPSAEKINNHMMICQQMGTPTADPADNKLLRRLSNHHGHDDPYDSRRDHSSANSRRESNKKRRSRHPRDDRRSRFTRQYKPYPRSDYKPERKHARSSHYEKTSYGTSPSSKSQNHYKSKSAHPNKPHFKKQQNFEKPSGKDRREGKKPHFESHQLDQESICSGNMTSVHSASDQESQGYSMSHSSGASTELDNLQLDADHLNDFDLIQLEEVSASLEQECLALEAEQRELDINSIFAEDTQPAASKPEPGEIIEEPKQINDDAMSITDSGASQNVTMDDSIPRKNAKSDS